MSIRLRVLIVEDSENDALLVVRHLRKGGYEPEYERVETADAMRKALAERTWDLILCDYSLPGFSGLAAIALVKETGIDLPFILVSGAIGEEVAVTAMKAGANDYVMKDNLARLVAAIERELKEAESRTRRREAEESLRNSERLLADTQRISKVGGWEYDVESGCGYWTDEVYRIYGVDPSHDRMESENALNFYGEEHRPLIQMAFLDAIKEGVPYDLVLRFHAADGTRKWVRTMGHPVVRDGKTIKIIGNIIDITEVKEAEVALRSSERRLAEIIDFFPDATLVIDREGNVLAWNRAMETMTGVSADDMVGKGNHEYALPFYGERRPILIDMALCPQAEMKVLYMNICRKGDILTGESYVPNLPGGYTYLSATASILRDEDGEIVAAIECIRDNTEKRKAQEELWEAEERYRGIFENAQEGIHRTTPDGRIILANQAMARIFGYDSPEELMARVTDAKHQLYVHPEEREKLKDLLQRHGIVKNYEAELRRKDGTPIWVSLTLRAVRDAEGHILYYEGLDEDITDRKLSIEKIRKALGATVQAIAMAVEARDPYTAGHQRRVADLARAVATDMGLSADKIEGIRTAAIIHDLGKISIPAEILSKPAKLSPVEFKIIKTHPYSGYEILKEIEFPWPVARMILEHHERMDGSGYPGGLKGAETLLESRILQVADVVESMASHRPYRPTLGIEAALDEIWKNQGKLYDLEVVDACIRLFRKKGYRLGPHL